MNPDVEKQADDLDRRFAQSGLTGPLHCVPVIVKDNFETKGLQTSDGALAFAGYLPDNDVFEVQRVKEAAPWCWQNPTWRSGRLVHMRPSTPSCRAIRNP